MSEDFKFYGRCETCGKKRVLIRKREVPLPTGLIAKSQKKMCNSCFKQVLKMLESNKGAFNEKK